MQSAMVVVSTVATSDTPATLAAAVGPTAMIAIGRELVAVPPGGSELWRLGDARAALDASAIGVALPVPASSTELAVYETATGRRTGAWILDGEHSLSVVAPGGRWLALTRHSATGTELTVAEPATNSMRRYSLNGEVEPEAFSPDGTMLFILASSGDGTYRVRTLDLATGDQRDTSDRLKTAEPEDMTGLPVHAVLNGELLSTLYRDPASVDHPAFVHTLNLATGWSHCADLPAPFGSGPVGSDAIAVSRDGATLYVASGGKVASIDVDAVRRPSQGVTDIVRITVDAATPPDMESALSPDGSGWSTTGLVVLSAGTLSFAGRSTVVDPTARLTAVFG